jgi:hypothetical protein
MRAALSSRVMLSRKEQRGFAVFTFEIQRDRTLTAIPDKERRALVAMHGGIARASSPPSERSAP